MPMLFQNSHVYVYIIYVCVYIGIYRVCMCVRESVNKHWAHKLFSGGEDIRENNLKKPGKPKIPMHKCENGLNCTQIQIHLNSQADKKNNGRFMSHSSGIQKRLITWMIYLVTHKKNTKSIKNKVLMCKPHLEQK